jgi:pyruvate dehydrogenase E1 component alpha subunit
VAFFGDGATSQPDFHNAMTFAAIWKAPVVIVCQNNHWSISVPTERSRRRRRRSRARPRLRHPGVRVDGNDVLAVLPRGDPATRPARAAGRRAHVHRERHLPHGPAQLERRPDAVPLERRGRGVGQAGPARALRALPAPAELLDDAREAALETELDAEIRAAIAEVESGASGRGTLFEDVYAELPWHLRGAAGELLARGPTPPGGH